MRTSFKCYSLYEYLTVRYNTSSKQTIERESVFAFKNGHAPGKIYKELLNGVKEIIGSDNVSDYCVCFIPASTYHRTITRFSSLASMIRVQIGCSCSIDSISCPEHESGHLIGKSDNPTEGFSICEDDVKRKRVILIDDVITRGRTFCHTANLLLEKGALDVCGLFLAKSARPDKIAELAKWNEVRMGTGVIV